jgi:hypothetical protein
MNDPDGNVLFLLLLKGLFLIACCFSHIKLVVSLESRVVSHESRNDSRLATPDLDYFLPGAFFLATAALRGPLRVRAFVEVR